MMKEMRHLTQIDAGLKWTILYQICIIVDLKQTIS